MGPDIGSGADVLRPEELFAAQTGGPSIDPSRGHVANLWAIDAAGDATPHGFPELDCLRQTLPPKILAAAERRAERLATGADRVLVAAGTLDDDTYLAMLGATLGIPFETFDGIERAQCPLDDDRLIESIATGLLPLTTDTGSVVVLAPRGLAARKIIGLIADNPAMAARLRFTSAKRFSRFVMRGAGNRITARASDRLKRDWPTLSAASPHRLGSVASRTSIVLLAPAGFVLAPGITAHAFEIGLATVFVAWLGLRLIGAFVRRPAAAAVDDEVSDEALPTYSVICALYREASSVNGLLSALEKLDYPALGSKCTNFSPA